MVTTRPPGLSLHGGQDRKWFRPPSPPFVPRRPWPPAGRGQLPQVVLASWHSRLPLQAGANCVCVCSIFGSSFVSVAVLLHVYFWLKCVYVQALFGSNIFLLKLSRSCCSPLLVCMQLWYGLINHLGSSSLQYAAARCITTSNRLQLVIMDILETSIRQW